MKREEALRIIKECKEKGFKHTFYTLNEYHTALDIAIKALEQEPCEDAISRQAVLDVIDVKAWEFCDYLISNSRNDEQKPVSLFADNLRECVSEELPPVTPQPKVGHWVEHPEIETSTPEYLMFYECSECGDKQCFCKSDIHKKRFCGNCGCRMIEPQESEVEE